MTTTTRPERAPLDAQQHHAEKTGRVGAGVFNPRQLLVSFPDALRKLDPRHQLRNPVMFVVWVGLGARHGVRDRRPVACSPSCVAVWLWFTVLFANLAEAVAEGRGKAQAESLRRTKKETMARRLRPTAPRSRCPAPSCGSATWWSSRPGEVIPGDGDVVEGIATVDESAITGESAPVIRESGGDFSLGHRRHDRAVRPDRRADLHQARRVLRGPDDRAGRGRATAEDAERDRADDPAVHADDHLPARRRVAAADRRLLGQHAVGDRADRAAGLPDPDHDRRAAVRDRHRGHGPAGAAQRARHLRPGGRGRRRRVDAAAGQDRHDHLRQPAGHRADPASERPQWPSWPRRRGCRASPTTPRRAAASSSCARRIRPAGRGDRPRGRRVRAVHRADPDERHRPRRPAHPQGRGRPCGVGPTAAPCRRGATRSSTGSAPAGGTPLVVAERGERRGARRDPAVRRGQAGHEGAVRRAARDGHPDRHDHRRQPVDGAGRSPTSPVWTTTSRRPSPRTRWR